MIKKYELAPTGTVVAGGADVIFNSNGPLVNVIHPVGATGSTVVLPGNYQIDYSVSLTLGVLAEIAIAVNGIVNPSTPISVLVAPGQVDGQVILPLSAGDSITLRNNSAIPFTLDDAPEVGAQLTIAKLD